MVYTLADARIYTLIIHVYRHRGLDRSQGLQDMFGSSSIATFYIEVDSARVYKQLLGFKERNQAQVRLKLRLNDRALALMKQPATWKAFEIVSCQRYTYMALAFMHYICVFQI